MMSKKTKKVTILKGIVFKNGERSNGIPIKCDTKNVTIKHIRYSFSGAVGGWSRALDVYGGETYEYGMPFYIENLAFAYTYSTGRRSAIANGLNVDVYLKLTLGLIAPPKMLYFNKRSINIDFTFGEFSFSFYGGEVSLVGGVLDGVIGIYDQINDIFTPIENSTIVPIYELNNKIEKL